MLMGIPCRVRSGSGLAEAPNNRSQLKVRTALQREDFVRIVLAGRSGVDLVQFGIAQQPASREIIDVAVTSERLNRFECHPYCPLGRVKAVLQIQSKEPPPLYPPTSPIRTT